MTTIRGLVDNVAGDRERARAERPDEELVRLRAEVAEWRRQFGGSVTRPIAFANSGSDVAPLYTALDVSSASADDLGVPGTYPFTRGIHPTGYRGKLWTMRQFAGFGSARDTDRKSVV